jgi:spermidine synthase
MTREPASRESPPAAGGEPSSRAFFLYLVATAVLCGALVMVIEIIGSRVIGPFFGVSLFVWTSLITVTLVALAAGYAAGGVLADRRGSPSYLYGIILLAGMLALLVPLLKGAVLKAALPLGLRAGAFAIALALFGPTLFLLGCVSPYIVKIAAREMRNIGRTVGMFYAVSTIGSFAGTVLTGFLLIAYFGVSMIFTVVGGLLILLGAGYFVFFRRRGLAASALVLPFLLFPQPGPASKTAADGTQITRVFAADTFYGNVKVIDYAYGDLHHRELMIDGLVQSGMDIKTGLSIYAYSYALSFLPYGINPDGRTCLVIGLGAGLVPRWYEQQGIRTDVVDIDPQVVAVAREYFGFSVSGDVVVEDARFFLSRTAKRYDYIILDVFNGDTTPGHLLSVEALGLVRERLTDRGILAINLIASLRETPRMTASIIRTLQQVFPSVLLQPNYDVEQEEGGGNITVLAARGPLPPFDAARTARFPVHSFARNDVQRFGGQAAPLPPSDGAIILTDDHNPIDFYDIGLKEWLRRSILANTDFDMLI